MQRQPDPTPTNSSTSAPLSTLTCLTILKEVVDNAVAPAGRRNGELFVAYSHTPAGWRWEIEVDVADRDRNLCLSRPTLTEALNEAVAYVTRPIDKEPAHAE